MSTPATVQILDEINMLEERLTALKHLAHAAHNQFLAQLEGNQRCRMLADPWNDGRPIEDSLSLAVEEQADAI